MSKQNVTNFFKVTQKEITKHAPEILTGLGIAGMGVTVVMAVKVTPKAMQLLDEISDGHSYQMTKKEIVKATWKCYLPVAISGVASIACIIGANSINAKRNAALATAFTLSESAFRSYKEKVIETIGEKKEQVVRDNVAKEQVAKNPVSTREVIITEKGNTLCYDVISGRYFKSDIDKLKKAENELNKQLLSEMYISLNDFYYEVGLKNTKVGDELGWNIDEGLIDLEFNSQLAEDGTPCLVVDYRIAPRYNFSKLM